MSVFRPSTKSKSKPIGNEIWMRCHDCMLLSWLTMKRGHSKLEVVHKLRHVHLNLPRTKPASTSPRRDSRRGGPTPPLSPQYPPEFQHLRNAAAQAELQGEMPRHPLAPTPAGAHSTSTSRASTKVRASPLSLASSNKHDRTESANSARYRSGHGSIRGLPISQPVGMADLNQSVQYAEMRSPLSPRLYDPGPPPPTPGKQVVASAIGSRAAEAYTRRHFYRRHDRCQQLEQHLAVPAISRSVEVSTSHQDHFLGKAND